MHPYTFLFKNLKPPSCPSPPTHVGTLLIQSTPSKKLSKMAGNLAARFLYSGWS